MWRRHHLDALETVLFQAFAMLGIGDLDEFVHSLTHILAEQRGNAVFRDNIVDVSSRSNDASAC